METASANLEPARKEALLGLLDDTSPAVRQALVAYFAGLSGSIAPFLREIAHGSNRLLAGYARWYLEELKLSDPIEEFRAFIRSGNYELESGALLLARAASPQLDIIGCRTALDAIAARCRELIAEPASPREKCRVLNRVLFHEWGFRGDIESYTDPRNSLIDQVLERRLGTTVSLSILYLLVASRLDLDLDPVGMPGHFVVGCFSQAAPFFVDPFDHGLFRDASEIFLLLRANHIIPKAGDLAPTPVREVLCRSCRNLASHCAAAGEGDRAKLFAGFVEAFEAAYAQTGSGRQM